MRQVSVIMCIVAGSMLCAVVGCILYAAAEFIAVQRFPAEDATQETKETSITLPLPWEEPDLFVPVQAVVTAYCPCVKCCGRYADGKTSTGVDTTEHPYGLAADPKRVPYGSMVKIPGFAGMLMVDDTGGAMRRSSSIHLDIRFPTHQEALIWGIQELTVKIRRQP